MRLQLSKRTGQALEALLALADADDRTKASVLADRVGATAGLLPQILNPLVKQGWVASATGPTGGYLLVAPLHEIRLLALIDAVEGPTDTDRCVLVDGACSADAPCALHEPWLRARTSLMRELHATALDALHTPNPQPDGWKETQR